MRIPLLAQLLILGMGADMLTVQAAPAGAVVAWGANVYGQTTVPIAALSEVTAIASGSAHTVALKSDGTVVAWGYNYDGQVTGTPTTAEPYSAIASPVMLGGQAVRGVVAIAAGDNHTVALKVDGSVVAWGRNNYGQTTVPPAAQNGVTGIAAGFSHTVAVKADGSVVAWGNNNYGQITVPPAAQSGVTAIATGYFHTVAVKTDGSVVAWGQVYNGNTYVPVTVPAAAQSGVRAIAAGYFRSVAEKADGSIVAWGQMYNGSTYVSFTVPAAGRSGVTAIAPGEAHTLALKDDGLVVAWGLNQYGQTTVPVTAQSRVIAIAAGRQHSVALVTPPPSTLPTITTLPVSQTVELGRVASFAVTAAGFPLNYQWRRDGINMSGATGATLNLSAAQATQGGGYTVVVSNILGSVTSAPPVMLTVKPSTPGAVVSWGQVYNGFENVAISVPVKLQSGVVVIAAGDHHAVAVKNEGSVVAWGGNDFGQVTGTPTWAFPHLAEASPVMLGGQILDSVTAIAAGFNHTVALKSDGSMVAWGNNRFGQVTGALGDDLTAIAGPVTLGGQVLRGVVAIAAGFGHTVALKSDGSVVAWGDNRWGQVTETLDEGLKQPTIASPVSLGGQIVNGVVAIAAGTFHTVALKIDGTVVAWGSQTDVPVAAQSGVVAIAAGGGHTVALKADGTVVAWGDNYDGQVTATPTTAEPYSAIASPVTLGGQLLSGVVSIAAGYRHTAVLKNDGTIVAWGANRTGAVTGNQATTDPYSAIANPVILGGQVLRGVTAIAAGWSYTVAIVGTSVVTPYLDSRLNGNGNELTLSWPTNATGFKLQSTSGLTSPLVWNDSTDVPTFVGTQLTVTHPISGGARYYRLRKP